MLKTVGIGVAMGNAIDQLKATADDVCGPVDENGIYHYCVARGLI
jgi:hydroxymethylpyrimidine pyrophosphatase-like HAD family hydrolase